MKASLANEVAPLTSVELEGLGFVFLTGCDSGRLHIGEDPLHLPLVPGLARGLPTLRPVRCEPLESHVEGLADGVGEGRVPVA
eukprot:6658249-Pyramimonas_sp.AAC.1